MFKIDRDALYKKSEVQEKLDAETVERLSSAICGKTADGEPLYSGGAMLHVLSTPVEPVAPTAPSQASFPELHEIDLYADRVIDATTGAAPVADTLEALNITGNRDLQEGVDQLRQGGTEVEEQPVVITVTCGDTAAFDGPVTDNDDEAGEDDDEEEESPDCVECSGSGTVEADCYECSGTGNIEDDCSYCDGTGKVESDDDEVANVPVLEEQGDGIPPASRVALAATRTAPPPDSPPAEAAAFWAGQAAFWTAEAQRLSQGR